MNTHSAPASGSDYFYASPPRQRERAESEGLQPTVARGKRFAPYVAFFVMVFASMAAAAAVVSEAPMMVVGLY
ncbi:MAG: hypothetical protein V4614_18620 [Pseudomonadota bacterium]